MNKEHEQRTLTQNKALYRYFELVAQALNDSGQDMSMVLLGDDQKIRSKVDMVVKRYYGENKRGQFVQELMDIIWHCVAKMDLPWSKESVKEKLWKPIQRVVLGKDSTTELDTANPSEVYAILSRHLSEHHGINIEFPSKQ